MDELLAALRALDLQQRMNTQLQQENQQLRNQLDALTVEKKPRAKKV